MEATTRMRVGIGISTLGTTLTVLAATTGWSCSSEKSTAVLPPDAGVHHVVKPDRVAPQVVSRMPADGDDWVSVRTPIQVTFSEPVRLGASPATLFANDAAVPTTATLSPDAMTMTIRPNVPLAGPARFTVTFEDVDDLGGNPLARPPWSWSSPTWLPVGAPFTDVGDARTPVLAAGPGERISVAWTIPVDGGSTRTVAVHTIDTPKGAWAALPNIDTRSFLQPTVLVDKKGSLLVAWIDHEDNILAQRWTGTEWSTIARPPRTMRDYPISLVGDEAGILFLAHHMKVDPGQQGRILVEVLDPENTMWNPLGSYTGEGLPLPVNDIESEGSGYLQSLVLDKNGVPHVAYTSYQSDSSSGRVRAWSGSSWTPIGPPLNPPHEQVESMRLAIDDANNRLVLVDFRDRSFDRHRVQIVRWDGASWVQVGADLANVGLSLESFFGPTRGGHSFAVFRVEDKLHTIDVTKEGWTAIPSPPITFTLNGQVAGAIDPQGVPVITLKEGTTLQVHRLNR